MNIEPIEEDYRFATKVEVEAYEKDELCEKPHIPGHHFSQLMDQIAGFCNVRTEASHAVVITTGGTGIWIANSMFDYEYENELFLYLEDKNVNLKTEFALKSLSNVANYVKGSTEVSVQDIALADILILACREGLSDWLGYVAGEPKLLRLPKIVYDPAGLIENNYPSFKGKYFMGSDVWTGK